MSLVAWFGFLLAAILISVTPGPGAALSMSTGLRHGYAAALVAILGLQTAIIAHLAIVALGFGALLAASEAAFTIVKLIGAGYLIWLGIQKWRALPIHGPETDADPARRGLFLDGLMVNLTNPKAIIFVAALVPQFIDPQQNQGPQYLLIAATLCLTDLMVMSIYALMAVRLGSWLHDATAVSRLNFVFGGLFVLLGVLLGISST